MDNCGPPGLIPSLHASSTALTVDRRSRLSRILVHLLRGGVYGRPHAARSLAFGATNLETRADLTPNRPEDGSPTFDTGRFLGCISVIFGAYAFGQTVVGYPYPCLDIGTLVRASTDNGAIINLDFAIPHIIGLCLFDILFMYLFTSLRDL